MNSHLPMMPGKLSQDKKDSDQQSVSRLLAFISGLVSVGLACIITTFYIWQNFLLEDAKAVNLDGLVTALLTLGIGVIPYAFNKITSALRG